jgi:alkaline phosphatase
MNKTFFSALFLSALCCSFSLFAQERSPLKEYTNPNPYPVEKIMIKHPHKRVKNVILMVGDGMSLMHMYTAWTANRGKLWLDNAQAVGLSKTYCLDQLITDSGAGGTAFATGHKTLYHSVGVDSIGRFLPSLCTVAHQLGKTAGIAVTCRLWDATPADFCCHNKDRDNELDIIADYVEAEVDYVFGGGAKLFRNRPDGRDIFKELADKGFQLPMNWDELEKVKSGKVFAVPYEKDTPLPLERGDLLARASLKGIELLNQDSDGFFLMVEGSQLDDYGHSNNLELLMQETLDFDQTVGAIMKWAAEDGETLVIVTADHETGGLTLLDGSIEKGTVKCRFSTNSHSGVMVPVYAFGPGAKFFTGIYENTAIFHKIKRLLEQK